MKYPGEYRPKRKGNMPPRAGKLKIIKPDGTVEERPAMNAFQVQKIVGKKRGRRSKNTE